MTPASDLYRAGRTKLRSSGSRTRSPATVSLDVEFGFQVVAPRLAQGEELDPGCWRTMESQSKYVAWFLLPAEHTPLLT
jgi:hypothetical protein